ncbi:MAG TPA: LCP family protein [Acidimicrobiales bacterium]|nr:LCP family protein [Acidimicrobiales bacterium]
MPETKANSERGRRHGLRRSTRPTRARTALTPALAKTFRRRRILLFFGSIIGLFVLVVGGVFGYAYWRYGQFPKVNIPGLNSRPTTGAFDILIVGSDSRAFAGNTGANSQAYGSSLAIGGQRSDVTIIARVDPANQTVHLLSIPRDTYVKIPGHFAYISGYNRINTAFNNGPQLLVQTIQQNFHIPISDYIDINIEGLTNMVNAIGGVYLDFRYPVYDLESHLGISRVGCHLVFGSQAVALVRSRHLYYKIHGKWNYDGLSDWSRIQRQDAFFRALLPRLKGIVTSPTGMNSFLGAAQKNITIDRSLSVGEIISLARIFRHISGSSLVAQTLPTAPAVIKGEDVVIPAPQQDANVIAAFLAIGSTKTTSYPLPHLRSSDVATALLTAATVVVANAGVTVTTIPGIPAPSTSQIVTNTQPEPWNPVPCHVGG